MSKEQAKYNPISPEQRVEQLKKVEWQNWSGYDAEWLLDEITRLQASEQAWRDREQKFIDVLRHYAKDPISGNHARFILQQSGVNIDE